MQSYVIALYIRLSLEDYKYDSLSIENQSLVLHEYAAAMPEALHAEVLEFIANPDSAITKAQVKDLKFPKEAVIGGVIRGEESIIASPNTQINPYDRVVVFALPQVLTKVNKFFL